MMIEVETCPGSNACWVEYYVTRPQGLKLSVQGNEREFLEKNHISKQHFPFMVEILLALILKSTFFVICEKKPRNLLLLDDLDLSSWVAVGQGGRQHRRALVKLDELARIQREHGELIDSQLGGYFVGLGVSFFFLKKICFVLGSIQSQTGRKATGTPMSFTVWCGYFSHVLFLGKYIL